MGQVTEADILGRRIERLMITSPQDLTQTALPLYAIGSNPFITPSQNEVITHIQMQYSGTPNAGSFMNFGLSSSTAEWFGSINPNSFSINPYMFGPNTTINVGPPVFTRGSTLWFNQAVGWHAGAVGTFTIYGFGY